MSAEQDELILAQEQGAIMRPGGASKEVEAEFGVGIREGTLVLTNKRLIFARTNAKGEELPIGFYGEHLLLYSEVEDLDDIPDQPPNVFIPLETASAKGHKRSLERPSLEVSWKDTNGSHTAVFTENLTGRRMRNLNDWALVIENIKNGTQKLVPLPMTPSVDTLDGKVMHVMADMQEKGVFEIEEDVESEYGFDLDPDEVQAALDNLSSKHLLTQSPDSSGVVFYPRSSPHREHDFSSYDRNTLHQEKLQ